eukprot:CAMPEP_0194382140 /NCGR_PEP_ID=MMETSP0174-20130528/58346_1 /TAXON_ID=216777 /ORGANISM="Proboscia alata, Strain PI-D3" /LENGTH=352 /DNA_ID=CAMNT_0039167195 /DNA_START=43 /DNA_END=1101 /DNA_ORIENTATION=-
MTISSTALAAITLLCYATLTSSLQAPLVPGNKVLLIGPGFLQLNIAKHCLQAGLEPIVVAPQKRLDTAASYINDPSGSILKKASIGIPDEKNTIHGVVFCSEEGVLGPELVSTVLEWKDAYVNDSVTRCIACAPISKRINKDKKMGWVPIFNNDAKEEATWIAFVDSFQKNKIGGGDAGTLVRYGGLYGGSVDGPDELQTLGLDESIYKMSYENYRDLKERAFDRFRLGAQVMKGDMVNPIPAKQKTIEERAINKESEREAFRVLNGYPEQDRTNRHTLAAAVVQSLMRDPSEALGKEFTVLSKARQQLPVTEDWDSMFASPGAAEWPDPYDFVMPEGGEDQMADLKEGEKK